MDPSRIGLFALAERRLAWAEQRQAVLAANIANANSPSYKARDLQPFADTVSQFAGLQPVRTQPGHLGGTTGDDVRMVVPPATARSPDGNTVSLDEQLTKVADTENTQALVTTLYKKYMAMFGQALGKA